MGTVRFVLRADKPNSDGKCPVQMLYQIPVGPVEKRQYIKKSYNTKLRILPVNWIQKDVKGKDGVKIQDGQQAVYAGKSKSDLTQTEVKEFNQQLAVIGNNVSEIEKRFQLNKTTYTAEMVLEALHEIKAPSTRAAATSNELFAFIDDYIKVNKQTREKGSLSVYRALKQHLHEFQKYTGAPITFESIDYTFFQAFQNFLLSIKKPDGSGKLNNTTIAKQLSTVKTFLNYARNRGHAVSDKYKGFSIKRDELEVIALTNDEFETLYNLKLPLGSTFDRVRDIFSMACVTGLRYSDLKQLRRVHIKGDEIRLTVTKTKTLLSIPLNQYSLAILDKYKKLHAPLPMMSNQKMNKYLKGWSEKGAKGKTIHHKGLCETAGITEEIEIVRQRGSETIKKILPKYKLIGVHSGRKTFASLSLEKGMSAEEVMSIGGWKDYKSFKRYVKITEQRKKVVMAKAWGPVKNNLKAV